MTMEKNLKENDQIRESISRARFAYNSIADQYDNLFTPFQEVIMYPRIEILLESVLGDFRNKKILDLGCGTGAFVARIKEYGADVVGIDISARLLDYAKFRGCRVIEGSIHELPFQNESFDAIISNFVLHYLPVDGQINVFKEAFRTIRSNGVFVFSYMHPFLMRLGRRFENAPHYRSLLQSYYEPQREENMNFHGQTFTLYLRDFPEIINSVIDSGFAVQRILDADFPENLREVLARIPDENSRRFIQNFRHDPYAIFVAARKI